MAIGYICPCCGEKVDRSETAAGGTILSILDGPADASSSLWVCQPCGVSPKAPLPDLSVHTLPSDTPVVCLDATRAFELLTDTEQRYAHALARADWEGAKICLLQCSVESVPLFALFQLVFGGSSGKTPEECKETALTKDGISETEWQQALLYVAGFYGNLGNYKSFGDTKFIPQLSPERFYEVLKSCASPGSMTQVEQLWNECHERMYSLTPRQRQLGLGETKGISNYFSANCSEEDALIANSFLDSIGISAYNTRLFKESDTSYEIRLASALTTDPVDGKTRTSHDYQGKTFRITRGDYAPLMQRVVDALNDAIPHAANDTQIEMLRKYIESFSEGSIEAHKDASRQWIRDKGPAVESYIGFIESYRDPSGVRGEWEGFVSCVNKDVSRKFQALVDHAESFLTKMPWPIWMEKDQFLRPDFTSLEVLSFGSSGVPAGINIPNYDDIRQSEGFKNVSLGNVLKASYGVAGDKAVSFIVPSDQDLYKALKGEAFEVQVGIHELLGHGSGKLYHQGTLDAEALKTNQDIVHPLTKLPITGPFYAAGATWSSTFGKLAPSYEECRAECTGLFLCLEPEILQVFGVDTSTVEDGGISDVTYVNWLLMARAGLTGLEFYTPETQEWRQAHMQARYVILRILLENKVVTLETTTSDEDGKPNVEVHLKRDAIATLGRDTIGDFLLKLQVHKSLGDLKEGSNLYLGYSEVTPEMLLLREIVMARKEPRKLLVQPHLKDNGNSVELQTFPSTPEGMIASFVARFPAEDPELLALYEADKEVMTE